MSFFKKNNIIIAFEQFFFFFFFCIAKSFIWPTTKRELFIYECPELHHLIKTQIRISHECNKK